MKSNALAAAGMFLVLGGCGAQPAATPAAQPPAGEAWITKQQLADAGLKVETVAERDLAATLTANGRVTFDDSRVAHVLSPVTGRVTRILGQLGERVQRGAPLAIIASPDLGQSAADAAKARSDAVAATREYERQKELFGAHAGSARDLEAAENVYEKARSELERADARAALLGQTAGRTVAQEYTLHAPIDGEIIARNVNPGAEVQGQYSGGSTGELFTVGSLDHVWVLADVYEVDLARVRAGAPARVTIVSQPAKPFPGTVDWISGALDSATHTAKVRCAITNATRELRPEMFATVAISVDGGRGVALPRSAVLRLGDETVVFVRIGEAPTGDVRFQKRAVLIDEAAPGEFVAVASGLKRGEEVVTTGAILLAGML